MNVFDPLQLGRELGQFPGWKRVAFMAACAQRMLSNYTSFQEDEGWGDVAPLEAALAAAWRWVATGAEVPDVARGVVSCEQQAPDPSEFASQYVSAALDAANVMASLLESLEDPSVERGIEVASLARDSVDMFVQRVEGWDPNAPDFEGRVLNHPLMQTELAHQADSIAWLKQVAVARSAAAVELPQRHGAPSLPVRRPT